MSCGTAVRGIHADFPCRYPRESILIALAAIRMGEISHDATSPTSLPPHPCHCDIQRLMSWKHAALFWATFLGD